MRITIFFFIFHEYLLLNWSKTDRKITNLDSLKAKKIPKHDNNKTECSTLIKLCRKPKNYCEECVRLTRIIIFDFKIAINGICFYL